MSTDINRTAASVLTLKDVYIGFLTTTVFSRRGGELTDVVHNVDLEVFPGGTVAIVSGSGSGKSTTVRAALSLLPSDDEAAGSTTIFDGHDITRLTDRKFIGIRGSGIGLVPQDPITNLNPVWTVDAQVREALRASNIATGSEIHEKTTKLLEQAGLSDAKKRIDQYPHEYSGGMHQRALITMDLAARLKLLIADESTSTLDVTVARKTFNHLDKLTNELDTSAVLVTHDLGLAAECADRPVIMQAGRAVKTGSVFQVLMHPQYPYTEQLITTAPLLAAQRGDRVVAAPATAGREQKEILVAKNLVRDSAIPGNRPWRKDTFRIVDDISFAPRHGRTIGIAGESDSGKSTVTNMALGLPDPTEGEMLFDGKRVQGRDRKEGLGLRRRIQPTFQNPYATLDPMRAVHSSIGEPLHTHKVDTKKEYEQRVFDLPDRAALLAGMGHRFPGELSDGQRQRVAVARAPTLNPGTVVCDEAVSVLDMAVRAQVLGLLAEPQEGLDLAYLFITHSLTMVHQVADETTVMEHSKMVERRPMDGLFDYPEKEYTQ